MEKAFENVIRTKSIKSCLLNLQKTWNDALKV